MLERKEQRAQEMAAFKLKAQSILKTFELKDKYKDEKPVPATSWLNRYIIDLTIRNFGVAFPLTLTSDLQLPQQSGRHDSGAVKAFLFSIKSLKFSAQRGETGQATMKGFSFQFVSQYVFLKFKDNSLSVLASASQCPLIFWVRIITQGID